MRLVPLILTACGGFLLAVLWMDLMFDVQALRRRDATLGLPESVLGSIAAYYERVTTTARPMNRLITMVMGATLAAVLAQALSGHAPRWLSVVSLLLSGAPIGLAAVRVYPNAVRLGSRSDSASRQSDLARAICRDHLFCFVSMLGFVVLQLYAAAS